MGTESGEGLSQIIRRKEVERRAGRGIFLWGVGNPLGRALAALTKVSDQPVVLFSAMRSKPRPVDSAPSALRIWLSYVAEDGREQEIPGTSLLTSRSLTAAGRAKESHYALVCTTDGPIDAGPAGELDASGLVNLVSGRPVGSSQVTSVVRQMKGAVSGGTAYPINFVAHMHGPGQVRLARSAEVQSGDLSAALSAADGNDIEGWIAALTELKRIAARRSDYPSWMRKRRLQSELFA